MVATARGGSARLCGENPRELFVAPFKLVVVVIEDDMAMRQAIERVLKVRGLQSVAFASAEAAIAGDAARNAGCMVVDIKLPGVSGFEFCEGLTTRPPIIFISASDERAIRDRAMRLGAAAFFHKPFSGRSLADLVASLMSAPSVDASAGPLHS